MSSGARIYDADQITMVFMGILVDSGYADGEFCRVEQLSDDFTDVVGTDGEVARSKTNDRRATITVTLLQTSSGNAKLSVLNNLDKLAANGAGVGPLLIKDLAGTSLYTASKAWIAAPPKVVFSRGAEAREWTIRCADLLRLDGGN